MILYNTKSKFVILVFKYSSESIMFFLTNKLAKKKQPWWILGSLEYKEVRIKFHLEVWMIWAFGGTVFDSFKQTSSSVQAWRP